MLANSGRGGYHGNSISLRRPLGQDSSVITVCPLRFRRAFGKVEPLRDNTISVVCQFFPLDKFERFFLNVMEKCFYNANRSDGLISTGSVGESILLSSAFCCTYDAILLNGSVIETLCLSI